MHCWWHSKNIAPTDGWWKRILREIFSFNSEYLSYNEFRWLKKNGYSLPRLFQHQNESIKSIAWSHCLLIIIISEFRYVCPNLMPLQKEGISYWRIRTIQTFKYKTLLLKSRQNKKLRQILRIPHCVKSVQIWIYFWSIFSCICTEYRKIRTTNNSIFGHFSRSAKKKRKAISQTNHMYQG